MRCHLGSDARCRYRIRTRAVARVRTRAAARPVRCASCATFKKEMKVLSNELKFEEAQVLKEKINALVGYQAKSTIVNPNPTGVF